MKLIAFNVKCTGCRLCEVVCAFHHKKVFSRKISSVRVKRIERRGEFEIIIYSVNKDGHLACDLCRGEKEPLCVRFCSTKALTIEG